MWAELLAVLGSAFASALVPLINIEALLALAATQGEADGLALALTAGVGQMVGKVLWFQAGARADRLPWIHRRLQRPKAKASLEKWHERAVGRPWRTQGLLFVSALLGLPPYAIMCVVAGVLRVPFWLFLLSGLLGRTLRFWAIVGGAGVVVSWL